MTRRRTTTTVTLVAAILLALLPGGVVLALNYEGYKPIPGGTDGDDTLTGTNGDDLWDVSLPHPGGRGDDTIHAEGGADLIGVMVANSSDWGLTSDPGADTYYGGSGKDILDGRGDGFADTIGCGEGANDLASYDKGLDVYNEKTCERLDWTDEDLKDCATKPWDSADVKCKAGTSRGDRLIGTDSPDPNIVDVIWGGAGSDTLRGRRGHDGLDGGRGKDTLYGGDGDDNLIVFPENYPDKPDKLYGGEGDDRINATDNLTEDFARSTPDTISCGPGDHDWVLVDVTRQGNVVDEDPRGVKLTEDGQAGCELVYDEFTGWKGWWKFWRRR